MKIVNIVALASIFLCIEAHSRSDKSGKVTKVRPGKNKLVITVKDHDKGTKTKNVYKGNGESKVVIKNMNTQPDVEDTLD